VPSPVPEEPPQLVASFGFTFINTYASIGIDSVTPGPLQILLANDDTEVASVLVEPGESWDQLVQAGSTVTVDYEMVGVAGPVPEPHELPCEDEVYVEVEVNFGSGEAVSAVSDPAIFSCGGPGPEDDPAG